VTRSHREQRIAVGRRSHDRLGSNIASATRPVLYEEWLTESVRQPLTHEARDNVGRASGSEWNNDAHRSCRIRLCGRDARHNWKCRNPGSQMQKLTAVKHHDARSVALRR
jgi:hypothetical protein